MSRKRVAPEFQIIALFGGLSDEKKRMVLFGLNAMNQEPEHWKVSSPKSPSPAPSAGKKSRKLSTAEIISDLRSEAAKDIVSVVGGSGD